MYSYIFKSTLIFIGASYLVINLRKNNNDFKKYNINNKDIIRIKNELNSMNEAELVKKLLELERLKEVEKGFIESLNEKIVMDIETQNLNFKLEVLENEKNILLNTVYNLNQELINKSNKDIFKEKEMLLSKVKEFEDMIKEIFKEEYKIKVNKEEEEGIKSTKQPYISSRSLFEKVSNLEKPKDRDAIFISNRSDISDINDINNIINTSIDSYDKNVRKGRSAVRGNVNNLEKNKDKVIESPHGNEFHERFKRNR